jgi:hypothetical protein
VGGKPLRPGVYVLRLRAVDRAGNRSSRTRGVRVRLRYVDVIPDRVRVRAGKRFRVHVVTDAVSYRWLFAGRRGRGTKRLLVLRAPEEPRGYKLYVVVGTQAARADVVVAAPPAP